MRDNIVQQPAGIAEEFFDVAGGLTHALFVFYQSDAHITITIFAKANAGSNRNVSMF